eukprot:334409-Amphidinium_carterae.1
MAQPFVSTSMSRPRPGVSTRAVETQTFQACSVGPGSCARLHYPTLGESVEDDDDFILVSDLQHAAPTRSLQAP